MQRTFKGKKREKCKSFNNEKCNKKINCSVNSVLNKCELKKKTVAVKNCSNYNWNFNWFVLLGVLYLI